MSEKDAELARSLVDAWNRGDFESWEAGLDEEVTWVPLRENPQTKPIVGREATVQFVQDWVEPWQDYRIELIRLIDAGDRIVMCTRQTATHPAGGDVISMEMHAVCTSRDGKLLEARWFMDEAEALGAAGVSPAR